MAFLYGDCEPSPLGIDYLGYLRRMMALAVEILLAEDALRGASRRRRALQARTSDLEARLEALRLAVREAIGGVARSPEDDPVTRCANHIESTVDEVVARGGIEVRAQDAASAADLAAAERAAHDACFDAVQGFLRGHDFPDAALELELAVAEGGAYAAIARATTPYELATELELDLAGSPFATPEVRAATLSRTRLADAKLDKLIVVSARCDARAVVAGLRGGRTPDADGFDVAVDRATGAARLTRIRRGVSAQPAEASGDDARALAALTTAIAGALEGRLAHRTRLRSVTLDEVPLDEHDRPSLLIDRVFAAMAPQVHAIVAHSRGPGELSLREERGDGRREEIFVTHAALAAVVAQVPVARRRHFDVLGLPGLEGVRAPDAASEPVLIDSGAIVDAIEVSEPSISIGYDDKAAGGDGEA